MNRYDLMAGAWAAFIQWAAGEPEMRAAFTADTGEVFLSPPTSPIEDMIDKATGAREANREAFVEWVTREYWGLDEAPESYRKHLKELEDSHDA